MALLAQQSTSTVLQILSHIMDDLYMYMYVILC